jgi:AcrR family transcriptional regulator
MMTERRATRITADRFIDTMLALIVESGGSQSVNLRQIARRIGCAHTNCYNYFASYEHLRWAAFRRALRLYGEYLVHDLDESLAPNDFLYRLVTNLARYPEENQGLYRFIASDPIDLEAIPEDILVSVTAMKAWLFEVIDAACAPDLSATAVERTANIVLAYIDGETLNLINGRVVPGEDVKGRVVENAMHMIEELGAATARGRRAVDGTTRRGSYPVLDLSVIEGVT